MTLKYQSEYIIFFIFMQQSYAHNIIIFCKSFMFFKIVYGNQIHVMNTKDIITYGNLQAFIKSVFKKLPAKYTLTYKDSDDDRISLLNDVDMKILIESGINKVRIEIQESHNQDFYDQTQQIAIDHEPIKKVQEPVKVEQPTVVQNVEVPEVVPTEAPKVSQVKTIDESINEKLSRIMPEVISKIKEQVVNESKIKESKQKMEETIPQPQFESSAIVHAHVTCDECHTSPITGIRYKCVVCPDFDLCERCEATSAHDHPFLKIKHPRHTPIKIFAIIDDQEDALEINGQKIPLPGLQDGLNLLGGLFGQNRRPEECRQAFDRCRNHIRKFTENLKHHMNQQQPEQKVQPKVEQKVEPKVEQKVEEVQKPEPKKEQSTQPIIIENKKEQIKPEPVVVVEKKEQTKPQPKLNQQDIFVDAANYISDIMGQEFRKVYRFVVNYPGLSKEEILDKYLGQ